jgi:D-alanyl-D-alanine carboxypeptidase/D-alanyl-D-alanine-endopeptidase (penicillin-binding protein 4)
MKQLLNCLNSLTVASVATIALAYPSIAQVNLSVYPAPSSSNESIELYVPPPENNNTNNNTCTQLIGANIDKIISQAPNQWGILIESIDRQTVIYSHNADRYFIPASNTKLFTTAAALQAMNPETTIRKKSLRDWVNITNQRSNNFYADTLFRFIGGAKNVTAILAQLGINPSGFRLADGSGLSRRNTATPRSIVEILRVMYYSPNRDTFYASLPVAGISGTLRNRMRQTAATGTVYAKTGTLTGVRALSGYLENPHQEPMLFSIIVNNQRVSGQSLVKAIDTIVLQMTESRSCQAR